MGVEEALSHYLKSILLFLGAVQLQQRAGRRGDGLFYLETGSPCSPARMASSLRMTLKSWSLYHYFSSVRTTILFFFLLLLNIRF